MKIVVLGTGNVGTQLSFALFEKGLGPGMVYNRHGDKAAALASRLGCAWTDDLHRLPTDADLYICTLKDAALEEVLQQIPDPGRGLWVHTSGSLPMTVLAPYARHYGVLYPLQTFSRERRVSFDRIPLCLEASGGQEMKTLRQLAESLSQDVREMSSDQRACMHLAAVFACNFVNACYGVAGDVLAQGGLDFGLLLPLIEETAAKVHDMAPDEAQTGPAVRGDGNITGRHLALLDTWQRPEWAALYRQMSELIYSRHNRQI